jgi:hypothetical protein
MDDFPFGCGPARDCAGDENRPQPLVAESKWKTRKIVCSFAPISKKQRSMARFSAWTNVAHASRDVRSSRAHAL